MCTGPATLSRKRFHATETLTNEQDAGRRIKANQETGPITDDSQTRKDANILRVDMLQPKTTRRVGCWNVRTLHQTGKLAQVIKEMQSYKIELLSVSETRWTGSGSRQLLSGHHTLYSGRADDHHSRGVGIITTNEVHKSLLEWKPISERTIKARYNSVQFNSVCKA